MKRFVDVVNFNADASCLSSHKWLEALQGGNNSPFVRWLRIYAGLGKKMVLGFPGATVADIFRHNPEAIALINAHSDIFEIIIRPFSHDIALLRMGRGFLTNLDLGIATIRSEFTNICNYFLPPEFMLTNEQIVQLQERGILGIFINPSRFTTELEQRIPDTPYMIRGLFNTSMGCIPFHGRLTACYLHALQKFNSSGWNAGIMESPAEVVFSWRDGESSFLLPDGLDRESYWLSHEDPGIRREHLGGLMPKFMPWEKLAEHCYRSYPVHSFSAWMKEFRMLGFISRIRSIEERLNRMTPNQVACWLMTINSDILSAIEKRSPVVLINRMPASKDMLEYTIVRSERGFEGEEYLALLDLVLSGGDMPNMTSLSAPHLVKWHTRISYLKNLHGALEG